MSFDEQWLKYAERISASMLEVFTSDDNVLLNQSAQSGQLFMNSISVLDTDLPSGNAQAVNNLLMLSEFYYDTRSDWKSTAEAMLAVGQAETGAAPAFAGTWIQSLTTKLQPLLLRSLFWVMMQ